MKNNLIIYDSFFGNTEQIAQAIGDGLADSVLLKVNAVTPAHLTGLDLLIVGSPTRGFRASPAIIKFLKSLPANALNGIQVAAFDTRITEQEIAAAVFFLKYLVKMFGYAAEPIAARLIKKGGRLVLPPAGFFVQGTEGPLVEGEIVRAVEWGRKMNMSK